MTFDDSKLDLLRSRIRDIPDFPKEGILFKDITPLLSDPEAFRLTLAHFELAFAGMEIDAIVGIESRGFIFGAALAARLWVPFVPARKPGKLPAEKVTVEYSLEYGTDKLEMHADALVPGQRVLIVDDLLATGGTASAVGDLVRELDATVVAYAFVVELGFLSGRDKLDADVISLLNYD